MRVMVVGGGSSCGYVMTVVAMVCGHGGDNNATDGDDHDENGCIVGPYSRGVGGSDSDMMEMVVLLTRSHVLKVW